MKKSTFVAAASAIALLTFAAPSIASPLAMGGKPPAADMKMKNVDGKELTLQEVMGPKGTLVVFTCNACPFAKAWESRIVELGNAYRAKGVGVVAINSNDPNKVAEDGFEVMQTRAKERGMTFPYVFDATSNVARAFGASRTPEVFLFDAKGALVYHGAVDDNSGEPDKVKEKWLQAALDAVVEGKEVAVKETKAIGCSIKFRPEA